MHQTMKEFVEDPQFKALILKKWQGNFAKENGNSFLAKYHFLATDFGKSCIYHAQEAEVTTGLSQFKDYAQTEIVPYTFIMNSYSRKLLSLLAFSDSLDQSSASKMHIEQILLAWQTAQTT